MAKHKSESIAISPFANRLANKTPVWIAPHFILRRLAGFGFRIPRWGWNRSSHASAYRQKNGASFRRSL